MDVTDPNLKDSTPIPKIEYNSPTPTPALTSLEDTTPVEELTPEEASRIIHSHRKVRYGTACWPCRQRKVKCDNQQPCENCTKRDHPLMCKYKPNRTNKQSSIASDSAPSRKRHHSPDDDNDSGRSSRQYYDGRQENWVKTVDTDDQDPGPVRYLGQNSIPVLLREQSSQNDGEDGSVRRDMQSILGLDTSAPFPLMSSRHLNKLTEDIQSELPSDREVMKLFTKYKEVPQQFWGFVIDIDDLEAKLMEYLEERAKNAKQNIKVTKPVSASWLAILFSVLGVGSQYHDSPYHIRTKDAQKYIQISFHFLRISNFLLRPNLDSIQALLLTGFVLLNDMKAEASWALLGLTCRLAQSLGLHLPPSQSSRDNSPSNVLTKETVKGRLWWTCVWHDALTSLSFDRPPMTNIPCCPIPDPEQPSEGWSYLEAMYHLSQSITVHLNPTATEEATFEQILENCREFESVRDKVVPQLRSKSQCKSALDRLQHFAIRLHTSFAISVCCRPALRRQDCPNMDANQKKDMAQKCQENLAETVRMFLAMHQLSVIPTRSWAFTYHGLSSALLLGLLRETQQDAEVRQLQKDLISALSAAAAKETSPTNVPKTDKDIELSGPLARALTALKQIYDHGVLIPAQIKQEVEAADPGVQLVLPPVSSFDAPPRTPIRYVDPHQDAALTMAQMQNGGTNMQQQQQQQHQQHQQQQQGFNPATTMAYSQPPHNMQAQLPPTTGPGGPEMGQFNAVDMYESIFWSPPPDPWNSGMMDSMNFDFLAHPPPGQPPGQFYW